MTVLDVYPNHSWWLQSETAHDIEAARKALSDLSPFTKPQRELFAPAEAYCLVGMAAVLDLPRGTFDEIQICYRPTPLARVIIQDKASPWLKPGGQIHWKEAAGPERPAPEPYVPLPSPLRPVLRAA